MTVFTDHSVEINLVFQKSVYFKGHRIFAGGKTCETVKYSVWLVSVKRKFLACVQLQSAELHREHCDMLLLYRGYKHFERKLLTIGAKMPFCEVKCISEVCISRSCSCSPCVLWWRHICADQVCVSCLETLWSSTMWVWRSRIQTSRSWSESVLASRPECGLDMVSHHISSSQPGLWLNVKIKASTF